MKKLIFVLGILIFLAGASLAACEEEEIEIVAHKIVCDVEEQLPDWALFQNDPLITSTTVQEFLDDIDPEEEYACYFGGGTRFQWIIDEGGSVTNPGDHLGEAPGWTTSGPTGFGGETSFCIEGDDIEKIWVREVFDPAYLQFKGNVHSQEEISAEMHCFRDNYNYDNFDSISEAEGGLQPGETYYCVAFNVIYCYEDSECSHLDTQCKTGFCSEAHTCEPEPKAYGTACDDGDPCTVDDICSFPGSCTSGEDMDCSAFDRPLIATCDNEPDDSIPGTWDSSEAFTSICVGGACTLPEEITHECHAENCSAEAECSGDFDCDPDQFCNFMCQCTDPPECTTDAECDDGLYCNGEEICNAESKCEAGTPPDCSYPRIDTCTYPFPNDGIDGTWDYREGGPGVCNEGTGCEPPPPISHFCKPSKCGGCESSDDCNPGETCDTDVCSCVPTQPVTNCNDYVVDNSVTTSFDAGTNTVDLAFTCQPETELEVTAVIDALTNQPVEGASISESIICSGTPESITLIFDGEQGSYMATYAYKNSAGIYCQEEKTYFTTREMGAIAGQQVPDANIFLVFLTIGIIAIILTREKKK